MSLFNENFYTDDFDQEMIDYVRNLGNYGFRSSKLKLSEKGIKYGKGNNYFWTDDGFSPIINI